MFQAGSTATDQDSGTEMPRMGESKKYLRLRQIWGFSHKSYQTIIGSDSHSINQTVHLCCLWKKLINSSSGVWKLCWLWLMSSHHQGGIRLRWKSSLISISHPGWIVMIVINKVARLDTKVHLPFLLIIFTHLVSVSVRETSGPRSLW